MDLKMKSGVSGLVFLCVLTFSYSQTIPGITFTVPEGEQPPQTVGNVATASNLLQIVGQQEFEALRYSIVSQDSSVDSLFSLDETSGVISTSSVLDRESLCQHVSQCLLSLDVAVQSAKSAFFRKIPVSINVTDINDQPPRFINTRFEFNLSEGESMGRKISLPLASDKDSDAENTVQRYELSPSSLTFALEDVTTDGKVTSLSLSLTSDIDRESQDVYAFTVTAFDGGEPTMSGSMSVIINIIDENDNEPAFQQPRYEATVPESASVHTSVVQVMAFDVDMGDNAKVSYAFSTPVPERVAEYFTIDENTGLITVRQSLNSAGGSVFDFSVTAVDHGNPQLFTETQVIVSITDNVNDKPVIDVKLLFVEDGAATVPETSTIGRTAALISVKDTDSGRNGLVACQISGEHFQLQKLDSKEYRVIVARSLDREVTSVHNVTITCQDQGTPSMSSSKQFLIRVKDENDNEPEFEQVKYFLNIDENNAFPIFLGHVKAIDRDSGINGQVNYKIASNVTNIFAIDKSTGEISAVRTFDRETIPKYTFFVYAVDNGTEPLTGTATVIVNVGDKNDQSPKFSNGSYRFSVKENIEAGTYVGKVKAVDSDIGRGGEVQYTLRGATSNGVLPFIVDSKGEIYTSGEIDHEEMAEYNFDILASDLGTPPQITSVPVKIRVIDDNDNFPEINFPVPSNDSITIPHDMEPGTEIAIVQAYDLDAGLNGWLTYSLVNTNRTGLFEISPSRGIITLGRAITDDDVKKYNINISVHDEGSPQRATYAILTVEIFFSDGLTAKAGDTNMKIVIALVCITALLAIAVLVTLLTIRHVDKRKMRTGDTESKYSKVKAASKGKGDKHTEFTELKPGVVLVTEGNKLTKKTVTFKSDVREKDNVFATQESQYNQTKYPVDCTDSSIPPSHKNKQRVPSTSSEGDVSVIDILHQHKALVQSLRMKNKQNTVRKDGEKDPDVWSDSSGETIHTDSGHGDSDLDMNSSLKMSV